VRVVSGEAMVYDARIVCFVIQRECWERRLVDVGRSGR
jgi:hypothetical protein